MSRFRLFSLIVTLLLLSGGGTVAPSHAQIPPIFAPCGVVDDMQYPVDSLEERTLQRGYDDFGVYRARWGGNHVALDVAFRERGAPVYAAARGRVTLANIEEWNDERGVVIIEHFFPDGSQIYTVYGHLEETDTHRLPQVGDCVEMGDVIGAVGWPASSAQHMHFEVRDFLPDEGGPGYVEENPLALGWYHPMDFLMLWRLRLASYVVNDMTFDAAPTLPPAMLENGTVAFAHGSALAVYASPETLLWRVNMNDIISGLASLPDSRVIVRSRKGQTAVLSAGRYEALWQVDGPDVPFVLLDETPVFVTENGGLAAYSLSGEVLWTVDAPGWDRVDYFTANGSNLAVVFADGSSYQWRMVDASGAVLHEATFNTRPIPAPVPDGSWMLLADGDLRRIAGGTNHTIAQVGVLSQRTARMTADLIGNTYFFTGDLANTLLSWDAHGGLRWQTTYPASSIFLLPPLLRVDTGCLLYGLDSDGYLNIFNTMDGKPVNRVQLYPGGDLSGQPGARLLEIDSLTGQIRMGAGFLSLVTLDAAALSAEALDACLLG